MCSHTLIAIHKEADNTIRCLKCNTPLTEEELKDFENIGGSVYERKIK